MGVAKYPFTQFRWGIRRVRPARRAQSAARLAVLLLSAGTMFGVMSNVCAETGNAPTPCRSGTALPGQACRTFPSAEFKWSGSEEWAWKEICEGRVADFNECLGEELDPKDPKHDPRWLDGRRTLRPDFLRTILLREPLRSAIDYRGVRIVGAYFADEIDLSDALIERPLVLERFFGSSVTMKRLTTPTFVSVDASRFDGTLNMAFISVGRELSMRGGPLLRCRPERSEDRWPA